MITSAKKLQAIAPKGTLLFVTPIANVFKLHICSSTGIRAEFISASLYKKLDQAAALTNAGMLRVSNLKLDELAQE